MKILDIFTTYFLKIFIYHKNRNIIKGLLSYQLEISLGMNVYCSLSKFCLDMKTNEALPLDLVCLERLNVRSSTSLSYFGKGSLDIG